MNVVRRATTALFSLLLALTVLTASANTPRDPYKFFFQESFGDFKEELALAKEEGKKGVLIFFEMDECPFCHRMKTTVLNQPEVQEYFRKQFKIFTVDVEGDVEISNFKGVPISQKDFAAKENRVRATPVFAFFDLTGKRITRYTGATSGPEEFLWLGEYVADGHYKTTSFTKYKREKKAAK